MRLVKRSRDHDRSPRAGESLGEMLHLRWIKGRGRSRGEPL